MTTNAAESLTTFLTEQPYGSRKTVLVERVQKGITDLTDQIAAEVIAENPELAEVIRRKIQQAVKQALHDDAWLNSAVTSAVARVITKSALERGDEAAE